MSKLFPSCCVHDFSKIYFLRLIRNVSVNLMMKRNMSNQKRHLLMLNCTNYLLFFISDQMRKTQVGTNITEWMTIIFKTKNDSPGKWLFSFYLFLNENRIQNSYEMLNTHSNKRSRNKIKLYNVDTEVNHWRLASNDTGRKNFMPITVTYQAHYNSILQTFLIYWMGIYVYLNQPAL